MSVRTCAQSIGVKSGTRTAGEEIVSNFKGIVIFWIVMEGGIAHFGRSGKKQPKLKRKKWPTNLGPMDLEARRRRSSRGGAVDEALVYIYIFWS